ncbi:hypothetical protein [Streptomyces sp. NPDC001315]|uniref:hypothetical protein n=1 Tax=Streptomyces sp. NPDC001315 TaxID=3364562 RepID=UPI0036ABABF3
MFAYSASCAADHAVGAQRVAEWEERIAALSRMRDTLVRRMPWLGGQVASRELS